ncbi:MAG: hypothetical protein ACOX6U_02280 [Oscillospiraceae bacterium]|jgi:hypothetical protein
MMLKSKNKVLLIVLLFPVVLLIYNIVWHIRVQPSYPVDWVLNFIFALLFIVWDYFLSDKEHLSFNVAGFCGYGLLSGIAFYFYFSSPHPQRPWFLLGSGLFLLGFLPFMYQVLFRLYKKKRKIKKQKDAC